MLIQRLTIIGVGLIGGSLALSLKRKQACGEIIGCGRSVDNLQKAIELNIIDQYSTDLAQSVQNADMVMVAVPLSMMAQVFQTIEPHLSENTVITDGGSAKACVIEDARQYLGDKYPNFVAGHPIAGTEKSGAAAAFPELYDNRRVILTPTEETNPYAYDKVKKMWELAGANVVDMDIKTHDEVLAATSHVPHVLAYSLVDTLACMNEHVAIFENAAGGFRDFTRIASSNPKMWHDICLANRTAVLEVLAGFNKDLEILTKAIEQEDSETIMKVFTRAKAERDEFCG
ncbi:prephenate dehydrogenase/arogenate dehydrogenase family protein [Candidatus Albibeggiatoa sp. nov. NOAA]|uniref:prephenate dehydrogenase n=1 Tax=Candidatus Albibeggiatoa sp. nov. NOAA TaxID=3162724 RepID=UPI00330094EA|nr:prephenate dehydrogenase/arogenate dehydrogenase family protein [Thiotrichaceae bacterium]